LLKDPVSCHPEEPKAVLNEVKEGSLYLLESTNAGIPVRFAQGKLSLRSE